MPHPIIVRRAPDGSYQLRAPFGGPIWYNPLYFATRDAAVNAAARVHLFLRNDSSAKAA